MNRIALGWMLACSLAWGCADDADGMNDAMDGDGVDVGDQTATTIEAAEGGEVTLGGSSLEIPKGALSENVEITIEVLDKKDLPDARDIASAVYDFGPDGTVFDEPVTLTIEFDAGATPAGRRPVMAWLDIESEVWRPLADSQVRGDAVTATTDHFTPFAVIFTGGGQSAGACDDVGGTDCGGDLTGSWEFTLGCVDLPPDFLNDEMDDSPFAGCEGLVVMAEVDLTGTISFEEDGRYALRSMQSTDIVVTIPKDCLMGVSCAALSDENPATDTGDACEVRMRSEATNDDTGSYEIDRNTLITTNDADMTADDPSDYCVQGDTLTARVVNDDGAVTIFQAMRQ